MRYDTGRPRAAIRLRISQPRTTSLPCPAGLRARRPSPMMDVYLKSSMESVFFSSQGCQAIAFAHDGGTTCTPLSRARSHSFSVSTASTGSPSTTVSRITAGGLPRWIRRGVVRACGQRAGVGRGTSLVRRGRSRSACVVNAFATGGRRPPPVNQAVAHSSHATPVDVGIPGAKVAWHLLRGLADDFQTANKGPTERWIGNERLERKSGRLADEVLSL